MNQQVAYSELSQQDFLLLGINNIAYVKKEQRDGKEVFVIHSADGNAITALANHDIAFAAVRQNDMEPLSVHRDGATAPKRERPKMRGAPKRKGRFPCRKAALALCRTPAIRPRGWPGSESAGRSEEHTSELQSLMRISYA